MFAHHRISFFVCCLSVYLSAPLIAEPDPQLLEEIQDTYNKGNVNKAERDLFKLQKKHPDWQQVYFLKGQIHAAEGEIEEAVEAWSTGLMDTENDLIFHQAIIQLHLEIGEHGLNPPQSNGFITIRYNEADEDAAEALKEKHKWKAIYALQYALLSHPDWREGIILCCNLLIENGKIDESEKQLQHLLTHGYDYPEALVVQAKISSARKNYEEALQFLDRAESIQPSETSIHTQRWEILKLLNNKSAADTAWEKMTFYQSIPRFTYLDYSPENFDRFQSITQIGNGTEESTDEENQALQEAANRGVLALLDYEGEDRLDWILATLWLHRHHGAVEDQLYDALIDKEYVTEINQLLNNATNNCTARSCFRVLSHLKDQEGFLKALEMLPNDTDFIWHLDTAGALAKWGDPRAIEPLLKKLTLETPKSRNLNSINLGNFGYEDARVRAALALGVLQ